MPPLRDGYRPRPACRGIPGTLSLPPRVLLKTSSLFHLSRKKGTKPHSIVPFCTCPRRLPNKPRDVFCIHFQILRILCPSKETAGPTPPGQNCRRRDSMKATGIVRRIDDLGRVVIPKEIRRTMRIREGDPLHTTLEQGERFCLGVLELARRMGWDGP